MKENTYLNIIKETLADSSLIGDDCAFFDNKMLGCNGICVTQDSLVEDVHFSLSTITPFELGKKAVNVNLSDLAAVCSVPLCITISLSLPCNVSNDFVSEFYKGVNEVCLKTGIVVAGGDLTGSDKIFISITAIGTKPNKTLVSRSFAKVGDVVLTTGVHGDSAGGLRILQSNHNKENMNVEESQLVNTHLIPEAKLDKSKNLSAVCESNFAMMDTSDGLGDALYKIAKSSNVKIEIDFNDVPVSDALKNTFPQKYKDLVFWGGEDYQLVCCVGEDVFKKLEDKGFYKIGKVSACKNIPSVEISNLHKEGDIYVITEDVFEKNIFNHFGE